MATRVELHDLVRELRERAPYLKRLAFYTIIEEEAAQFEWGHLTGSKSEEIDACLASGQAEATIEAHQDGTGDQAQYRARGGV